ncbi:major facilitator superfamily transporter [Histomonas meleagridis]|uniref:major facilitator superfamily transporter n=1 Tax=Histomonas meleagridis TaxID=135588 RepID=UPI00355A9470|nr:major facilitator superfamily transporter [Histomonas meleagridis]KAH0796441.1 major facilitator superfamily transporter [Histomonas meleagridis]
MKKELLSALVILLGSTQLGQVVVFPSPTEKEIRAMHNVHIWAGVVARFLQGLMTGGFSTICPMYLVEIAPEGYSALFGSLNQIFNVIGVLIFDFVAPSVDFMILCYIAAAIMLLQSITVWFIMESPACENMKDEDEDDDKPKESICQKRHIKYLIIGVLLMFFQQFCGVNALLSNLATIMNDSGIDIDGNYQAGIGTSAQIITCIIGGFLMNKFGRRIIWIISEGIVVVSLLIFALNGYLGWTNILSLICIFLYMLGFGIGLGPIPWFIVPEYFPDSVRGTAASINCTANWLLVFCIVFIWPPMRNSKMGMYGSMLFYMAISIVGLIFGIFVVKEPENQNNDDDEADEEA